MTVDVEELLREAQSIQSQLSCYIFTQILGHPVGIVVGALPSFLNISSDFQGTNLLRDSFNHQIVATFREDLAPEPDPNCLLFISQTLKGCLNTIGFLLPETHSDFTEETLAMLIEIGHDTVVSFFGFEVIKRGFLREPARILDVGGKELTKLDGRTVTCYSVSGDFGE